MDIFFSCRVLHRPRKPATEKQVSSTFSEVECESCKDPARFFPRARGHLPPLITVESVLPSEIGQMSPWSMIPQQIALSLSHFCSLSPNVILGL